MDFIEKIPAVIKVNIPFESVIAPISTVVLTVTIIYPYLLYTIAYKFPDLFKKILSQKALILITSTTRTIQILFFIFEGLRTGISVHSFPIAFMLGMIGQILNTLIYKKFGAVRAYYGWELGLDNNPPADGFPLNLEHAQYKGCMFSILGFYFLFVPSFKLSCFATLWTMMYFYITLIESTVCGRKEKTE